MVKRFLVSCLCVMLMTCNICMAEEVVGKAESLGSSQTVETEDDGEREYNSNMPDYEDNEEVVDGEGSMLLYVSSFGVATLGRVTSAVWMIDMNSMVWYNDISDVWELKVIGVVSNISDYNNISLENMNVRVLSADGNRVYEVGDQDLFTAPSVLKRNSHGCIYTIAPMEIIGFSEEEYEKGYIVEIVWRESYSDKGVVYFNCVTDEMEVPYEESALGVNVVATVENKEGIDIDYADVYFIWYGLNDLGELVIRDVSSEMITDLKSGDKVEVKSYFNPTSFEIANEAPYYVEAFCCSDVYEHQVNVVGFGA